MSNVPEVTPTGAVVQKLTNALQDVGTVTLIVTVKLGSNVERTIVLNFPMISLVQDMIAAMTLMYPNVALVMQTGLVVQKPINVEKDLGTVTQIVNVKKALNVGLIIVVQVSQLRLMIAASSLQVCKVSILTHISEQDQNQLIVEILSFPF